MEKWLSNRVNIIFIFFLAVFLLYTWVLYTLQVKKNANYEEIAERQYVSAFSRSFDRGSIYFTRKDGEKVAAATVRRGFELAIVPGEIISHEATYDALASVISDLDHVDFIKKASRKHDSYEVLKNELSLEVVKQLKEKNIKGLRFAEEKWRYYPAGELAAQTIGFVGSDGEKQIGRYGLEKMYEGELNWTNQNINVNPFAEIFANIEDLFGAKTNNTQAHIITTIEPEVQIFLKSRLVKLQEEWHAEQVGGIIMDPKTGEIVALETNPSFDLNNFGIEEAIEHHTNPLSQSVFEMGSILKPLIMAIGIENNAITPDTTYYGGGSVEVGPHTIYNFDKKGRGFVSMWTVIGESLNTGMVFIAKKVPKPVMREYIYRLGFAERSGIDLPNEVKGLTDNLKSNRDIEFANIAFGQGLAINPIVAIRALATLANGGYLIQPHVVKGIEYVNKPSQKKIYTLDESPRIFQEKTVETMTQMLVKNVDGYLRQGHESLPGYSVAAKTGTAQVPNPNGGYYEDRNLHAFFGYFPAYEARYVMLFYAMYPKGVKYSSETLTDPFMDTVKYLINYYDVPPDRIPKVTAVE